MRILDRYLLREFLKPLAYCLCGFLVFWVSFQLFSELDEFQRAKLNALEIVQYYMILTPDLMGRVVPIALLLGLLYSLNNHSRHNEIVAMRVAGLSLWRISLPYLGVGMLCGAALFYLNEIWMPDSADRAEEMLTRHIKRDTADDPNVVQKNVCFNNRAGRTWVIGKFNLKTFEMSRPQVEWTHTNGARYCLYSDRAAWTNNVWVFYNVQMQVDVTNQLVSGRGATNVLALPEFLETPQQIKSEIKFNSLSKLKEVRGASLSLKEILAYQRWHPKDTRNGALDTKFHVRLAAAWACPVVVLIALPFGVGSGRRNVYVGVASSIFICFAYFILQRFAEAAGLRGFLSPWLAGWLPNLLFAGAGVLMTARVR